MTLGNTRLVEYGIHTEKSDIRAHVSVTTKSVYVYMTTSGVDAISNNDSYRKVPAYTGNIITAMGYLVPPADIPGCKRIVIPNDLLQNAKLTNPKETTTAKGNKAVYIVKEMLKRRLIPFSFDVAEITDEMMQISGTDIFIKAQAKVQVKCDWTAGPRELGGSGNLFLQIAECNPFKQH